MPLTGSLKNKFYISAKQKFSTKFEYFDDYKNINTEINVKCTIHNIKFKITPKNHIRSDTGSCPECKLINSKKIRINDNKYFINKSKKIFNDKYNYNKVNYNGKKSKIILTCIKHNNTFNIEPKSHYHSLTGGCKICINEIKNKNIIQKLNCTFDYSLIDLKKTVYTNQLIICKKCNIKIKTKLIKPIQKCINCKIKFKNLGKKIENIIKMRKNFNKDEYILKIKEKDLKNYYISNYGNIYNRHKKHIKGHLSQCGYIIARLNNGNKNKLYRVHRLVCITFNGNPPEKKQIVDHINNIRNDNRSINLRWVNHYENSKNNSNKYSDKTNIINLYFNLDKNDEIFKQIKTSLYGNFFNYSISNYGRIKNNKTKKLLTPTKTGDGYLRITLNKKLIQIHRLVCEIFNKGYKEGFVVNHIDENKHNNYYKNLEWCSIGYNNKYSKNKKINMYDKDMKLLRQFNSITNAYNFLDKKHTNNIQCQMKKKRMAYGFYWKLI